jgi:hypothetical protein
MPGQEDGVSVVGVEALGLRTEASRASRPGRDGADHDRHGPRPAEVSPPTPARSSVARSTSSRRQSPTPKTIPGGSAMRRARRSPSAGLHNMDPAASSIEHRPAHPRGARRGRGRQASSSTTAIRSDRPARLTACSGSSDARPGCRLVNAGWSSTDLEWVAPSQRSCTRTRSPHPRPRHRGVLPAGRDVGLVAGPGSASTEVGRGDTTSMLRELCRTLVCTDAYFTIPTRRTATATPGGPNRRALQGDRPRANPMPGQLARRGFARTVAWLPRPPRL